MRRFILLAAILLFAKVSFAQVQTGTPPFGSLGGGPFDTVDLANLDDHFSIPIINKAGRGTPFYYSLKYDNSIWYSVTSNGVTSWQPTANWGWNYQTSAATGYAVETVSSTECYSYPHIPSGSNIFIHWSYIDRQNTLHPTSATTHIETGTCGTLNSSASATSTDGSGLTLSATGGRLNWIRTRSGSTINPPVDNPTGPVTIADRNGNEITSDSAGSVFTDTLGTTVLTVSTNAPSASSPVTYTYTPPSGTPVSFTAKYTNYNIQTSFGCTGISEYTATNVPLVSEIDIPDGSKYTFSYDSAARLKSVTLPQGGTISYSYTGGNNGINCPDGSTATLTRTTPDGTWTYTHSSTYLTTLVTDPQGNQTNINFQGIYETERQVYQGTTSGTLLKTVYTCYNAAAPPCNNTAITLPITKKSVYVQWPGTGGLESRTDTFYDSPYGRLTEKDEYAYGAGAPGAIIRKTLWSYASLGNNIVSMPGTVTVEDGSGNIKAQTTYTYDQGSVTATSGTPQHVSVSGSRGNATTIAYLVSGSTTLSKTYTYYDTGNLNTATDVNGAVTTYTYGTGSCGNSFATSISEPLNMSRSVAWNCTGGVQTSVTDENNQPTTVTYNDADFWRENAVTDPLGNQTSFYYQPNPANEAPTEVARYLIFNNGSSVASDIQYKDGLGRTYVDQRWQSPYSSTLDSVSYTFDANGRPSSVSLPCSIGYTGTCSTPKTTTTYDALGRRLQTTDGGGGYVSYSYSQNDTYRTRGPAPSGENTKRKQFEYDALGRLTSVCEVTTATGSGPCGQTKSATGYWTKYTYDVLDDLTGVTQNVQSSSSQTRTFTYDGLGRITSETVPETGNGTKYYYYDSDSTMCGNGAYTSDGDLVKTVDAAGNCVMRYYDALHRLTDVGNNHQGSTNPCKRLRYDNSSGYPGSTKPAGLTNTLGRLIEAVTDTCSNGDSIITDEWFSYTARGETSDIYQSTPHSAGYYHVTESFWANGAVHQLSLSGLPTITYGVDGEGRVYSVSASSGQNPVTSTTYNVASLPTQVNLGSSDSDSYTYDPNTNRTTKYTFTVNGQSVVGTLTWNAIGSLGSLAITDPFYGPNNQTCSYSHDDLSRIASANCGSAWSQTFNYDPFGNISKSGSSSFQPTYSYLTNHMTQIGSSTPSYDANGNVTNDFLHTYAWDVNGRPVTIDGIAVTYDALGRIAEENKSGSYTQFVYTPDGKELALMNGQTLYKAYVPLPAGDLAAYNSAGLGNYHHMDWLGSFRLSSIPTRTVYFETAYAPFGETYAQTGSGIAVFTGMTQDTNSNLYDFPAREYGIQGRWPSPDPAGNLSVRPRDPQTWNRYAYVRNNPLRLTDPTGMENTDDGEDGAGGGGDGGGGGGGAGGAAGGDSGTGEQGGNPPADPNQPDPGQPAPQPDPGQPTDPTPGGQQDPSQQPDQCNNATCSSTNTCDATGCSNTTTVTVNGSDCNGPCLSATAQQTLGQVGNMVDPLTHSSTYVCWFGAAAVVGAGGGAALGGEAGALTVPFISYYPIAFRWAYQQLSGPALIPLNIIIAAGTYCNGG